MEEQVVVATKKIVGQPPVELLVRLHPWGQELEGQVLSLKDHPVQMMELEEKEFPAVPASAVPAATFPHGPGKRGKKCPVVLASAG